MKFSINKNFFEMFRRQGLYAWIRHYKSLFVLFFLILTGFVGYQWYQNLYRYTWTAAERQAYVEATVKETTFQEDVFVGVLKRLELDRAEHGQYRAAERDIFAGARKKEN